MGRMPRTTTQRHPPDQLIHAIRAALLSTIKAECPEVLDDLRDSVFTPLSLWMTRDDIVALLRRYSPRVHDPRLGSAHHQVRALIVCWARRWHLTAPWIRAEAWRTLRVWARWSGDSRPAGRAFGWAPLVDVDTTARLARLVETPTPTLREITHLPPRVKIEARLVETPTPTLRRPDLARSASRLADTCVAGGPGQRRD